MFFSDYDYDFDYDADDDDDDYLIQLQPNTTFTYLNKRLTKITNSVAVIDGGGGGLINCLPIRGGGQIGLVNKLTCR